MFYKKSITDFDLCENSLKIIEIKTIIQNVCNSRDSLNFISKSLENSLKFLEIP